MPTPPVTPEKQAEIEDLERAIRRAIDEEIGELAANLATTDDAHLFGDNEFKIRALAHKIAAKALEQHLAQKKRIRGGRRDLPALRPVGRVPFAPPPHTRQPGGTDPLLSRLLPLPALRQGALPLRPPSGPD